MTQGDKGCLERGRPRAGMQASNPGFGGLKGVVVGFRVYRAYRAL